jgi:hypothetical protein
LSDPCQEMLKQNIPPAIVRLLRQLANHCANENPRVRHQKAVAGQGSQYFRLESQHHQVFLQSCYVLASFSFRSDSGTQSVIGRLGGVDAILAIMRLEPYNELIQQFACWALGNTESNAQRVHRAGGIGVIVMSMETHRTSAHLQEWALRTLNNLCHYESLRPHVVNAGGLAAVREAVRVATERPSTNETADNAFGRTWAINALAETAELLEQ